MKQDALILIEDSGGYWFHPSFLPSHLNVADVERVFHRNGRVFVAMYSAPSVEHITSVVLPKIY